MIEQDKIYIDIKRGRGSCRVVIGDKDITTLVKSFKVIADVDSIPTLELVLVPAQMEITGVPQLVQVADTTALAEGIAKAFINGMKHEGYKP